ncbi:unnamed protein product, partial [Staurois parvus]
MNSTPSLVSEEGIVPHHWCQMGGVVPHHWYQWKEKYPIVDASGRNGASLLVSVGGIVPRGTERGRKRAACSPRVAVW